MAYIAVHCSGTFTVLHQCVLQNKNLQLFPKHAYLAPLRESEVHFTERVYCIRGSLYPEFTLSTIQAIPPLKYCRGLQAVQLNLLYSTELISSSVLSFNDVCVPRSSGAIFMGRFKTPVMEKFYKSLEYPIGRILVRRSDTFQSFVCFSNASAVLRFHHRPIENILVSTGSWALRCLASLSKWTVQPILTFHTCTHTGLSTVDWKSRPFPSILAPLKSEVLHLIFIHGIPHWFRLNKYDSCRYSTVCRALKIAHQYTFVWWRIRFHPI